MKELIDCLNALTQQQRVNFERDSGTTIGYLRKASSVGQKISVELCISIEKALGGAVKGEVLRPDVDWAYLRSPRRQGVTR